VTAGDSHTVALTANGECYNWGTYRDLAGVLGFAKGVDQQVEPALIEGLKGLFYHLF
jgi:alpha-tubulin suppressor-like RCC1 family protein